MKCPNCGGTNIIFDPDSNSYICQSCGFVFNEKPIYQGFEGFLKNNNTPRYSGTFTNMVHDHGVGGTEISGYFMRHLKQGRSWVRVNSEIKVEKKDRKLKKALQELNEYLKLINPPPAVKETAAKLVHEAVKDKNYKESTLRKIIIAAIYLSYRINDTPKSLKVFISELNVDEKDLWEGVRLIRESNSNIKIFGENFDPRRYVGYIIRKLNAPPIVETMANYIISVTEEQGFISGKSPTSLAAAAVYLAGILTNNKRNQVEVAETVGLSDVAIRNAYGSIIKDVDIEVLL
ncbi:MAG: transcription initiation factor IIB [Desulfurococcus sp.]|uniref:transcription initiation factor IIB n=1 Tax=Desulfurococcus sp. TaxID=51678 RepID=UPI003D0B8CD0